MFAYHVTPIKERVGGYENTSSRKGGGKMPATLEAYIYNAIGPLLVQGFFFDKVQYS